MKTLTSQSQPTSPVDRRALAAAASSVSIGAEAIVSINGLSLVGRSPSSPGTMFQAHPSTIETVGAAPASAAAPDPSTNTETSDTAMASNGLPALPAVAEHNDHAHEISMSRSQFETAKPTILVTAHDHAYGEGVAGKTETWIVPKSASSM